jgi:hypothetical protein
MKGLGQDLEPLPPLKKSHCYNLNHGVALVRQRSRVQIPAKVSLFCKKEGESGSPTLQSIVTPLQAAVTVKLFGIKPLSMSKGNSSSLSVFDS